MTGRRWGSKILAWLEAHPYWVAFASVIVAFLGRLALDPYLNIRQPFVTFFAAVIFCAWIGGVGPALAVLACGIPLAWWFFVTPRDAFFGADIASQISLVAFFLLGMTVAALGGRLNRIKQNAERAEKKVEKVSAQLKDLASERGRLQQEYERLSDELRGVDQRRDDFLSMLAEEFRKPLIPIASAASLYSVAPTAWEMESAMEVVRRETVRLGRLIDDLTNLFHSSLEPVQLNRQSLNLSEVVCGVAESVRSLAAQGGRELNVSVQKESLFISGDRIHLERAIFNLLMNSIHSTNPGGQIWITARQQDQDAVIKIRDTGSSMVAEVMAHHETTEGLSRRSLAEDCCRLGIGMTAVRQIVELHGGEIEVGRGNLENELVVRIPSQVGDRDSLRSSDESVAGTTPPKA